MAWWYVVMSDPDADELDEPFRAEVGPFTHRHEAERSRAHEIYPFYTQPPHQRD